MNTTILQIESAGPGSFDVRTKSGAYAGLVAPRKNGTYNVYFNSNATRGSTISFASVTAALDYIIARRAKKGWNS